MTAADIFASARGPIEPRPFPLTPLLEVARISKRRLVLLVGASGSAMGKASAEGLTWQQADTWAIRCGKHPSEVWETWWAECPGDEDGEP